VSSHSKATTILEITWSVIPLLILTFMFLWGAKIYFTIARPPRGRGRVHRGRQAVDVEDPAPKGRREINELHVPVGVPIKLTMTSEDVIHSFFLPCSA
jgi:cytochrome c oxidase subunit 2